MSGAVSPECYEGACSACDCEDACDCECHFEDVIGGSDDEWCPDCGESLPCQCDAHYDESEDDDE